MADRWAGARAAQILLVEDSPGDVRLLKEVLRDAAVPNELHVVGDGEEALAFLRRSGRYAGAPVPDVVLLDLNLPRKDGREVLVEVKEDPDLRRIPLIVFTTSAAERDVARAYDHHVNAYVQKPVDLEDLSVVVRTIESFWLRVAELPSR